MTTPQERYDRKNTVRFQMKLNIKTDSDIINFLNAQTNKQGKVKDIIRRYMKCED